MTEIIQSIHPYWVKKIFDGKKTKELRKSKPANIQYPFKVYIYETKAGAGAVVGEYICKDITTTDIAIIAEKGSCMPLENVQEYMGDSKICAWDISEVKKYENSLPLTYYGLLKAPQSWCYINI